MSMLTPVEVENRVSLMCSIQRALLGEIPDNLYAVTCGIRDSWIYIVGYFDGPVSDEDLEMIRCAGTEVISDFSDGWMIHEEAVSIQEYRLEVMEPNGFLAFKRKRPPGPREPQPEAFLTRMQAYRAMRAYIEMTRWSLEPAARAKLMDELSLLPDGRPAHSDSWEAFESSVNSVLREANTGTRCLEINAAPGGNRAGEGQDPSG